MMDFSFIVCFNLYIVHATILFVYLFNIYSLKHRIAMVLDTIIEWTARSVLYVIVVDLEFINIYLNTYLVIYVTSS